MKSTLSHSRTTYGEFDYTKNKTKGMDTQHLHWREDRDICSVEYNIHTFNKCKIIKVTTANTGHHDQTNSYTHISHLASI